MNPYHLSHLSSISSDSSSNKKMQGLTHISKSGDYADVNTFIGNHTNIDPEIFKLWIEGNSTSETASILVQRGALQFFNGACIELLLADIEGHFRTYVALEKLLQSPPRIYDQWVFQMLPGVQQTIIKLYYEFDDSVIRELLGKKLTARHRKDLDEISQVSSINIKSCRRQFDNLKRISKAAEELQGSVLEYIKSNFCLQEDLAKKYCAAIFISVNRFETSKRKLHYLSLGDFFECAEAMMTYWTTPLPEEPYIGSIELDREFLIDLRELKTVYEKEKDHKVMACRMLKGKISDRVYNEIESNFKSFSRTLINIAYGLNHSKELRDLFIDLFEKFIEPCRSIHWPPKDLKIFLNIYSDTGLQLEIFKSQSNLKAAWKRYMDGIISCIIAMYHL